MPRVDTIDVDIEAVNLSGDGTAHHRGVAIAVPFTIPGERVRVSVEPPSTSLGPGRAALVEVLRASPHRVAGRCPHFGPAAEPGVGPCGGCTWQHIAYDEQLRLKTEIVDRMVRAAAPDAPPAQMMRAATPADTPWGYRRKIHFVFGSDSRRSNGPRRAPTSAKASAGSLTMGHYVRGSRRVVPVRECPVHDEKGNELAFRLHRSYASANIASSDDARAGTLRSIAIRVASHTAEVMATLVVADDTDKRLRTATRRALETAALTSFHLNVHPKGDAFIFGRETRRISGTERLREVVGGVSFLISPTAFFQTNVAAAEILVRLVRDAVPTGASVLDLYAGSGLFALPLARAGHIVTAVEENRQAVADGEASRLLNRIPAERCRFIARRVEAALSALPAAEVVVMDPPREGASAAVLDAVFGGIRPRRTVYISCSPDTLGRDLRVGVAHGYRVRSVQPVDMFPHTAHIETVVVVER